MPIGPARMPLFDHLGELRRRLTIVVVSVIIGAVVMYFATPTVLDILKDPIAPYLPDGKMYVLTALGGFSTRFSIAIKLGVIMATPMIIWQFLAFFLPALKPSERKWVVPTVGAATALFFFGAVFCYFLIVPTAFEWMIGQSNSIGTALAGLEDYINTEILLLIGFGVAFELPLAVFYLAVFRIVPYSAFRGAWRYIYVALLVASASLPPDASPVPLLFMYSVMILLYEAALAVTRFVVLARDGRAGLSESRLGIFGDDEDEEGEGEDRK